METMLKNREIYLRRLIAFQDKEPVKIVTGLRRCGKSKLLDLMIAHLKQQGIQERQILKMNFESYQFDGMNHRDFYDYVAKHCESNGRCYLFLDEPQRVQEWERAVNAFRVDLDCDTYITGSNAYLLSGEFATYLSGRYVDIRMYPLTFLEFLAFHGFTVEEKQGLMGTTVRRAVRQDGLAYDLSEVFNLYLRVGGMPGIADTDLTQESVSSLLDGVYTTVIVRDILQRERMSNEPRVTDAILLERICRYMAYNVGNLTSISNMTKTLFSAGMLEKEATRGQVPSYHTIQNYVAALLKAYLFNEAKRYDIKGKEYLKTQGKFYIADHGLRNYLLGSLEEDRGRVLENVVYFELLKRGYEVAVGKIDQREVDFRARRGNDVLYIQVSESMMGEETRAREQKPLESIPDNYQKIILTMDPEDAYSMRGIRQHNLISWLIGETSEART